MEHKETSAPDGTAVRVALWRELHMEIDPPPHVFKDVLALKLANPDENWRERPDMDLHHTRSARASIVARARFVEELIAEQVNRGVNQYVILGAGLDTFAQRRPEVASRIRVFEVDRPGPQIWKQQRLVELGFNIPEWLRFVPVDFESGESWWDRVASAGFDSHQPAIVTSIGVSMYLTIEAIEAMMRQIAVLPAGSTFAMSYLLPFDLIDPKEHPMRQWAEQGARQSGTPMISYLSPRQVLNMAREAGFKEATHVSGSDFDQRYFSNRTDGLHPAESEEILVATT
jgi:methyltransferase (TIGR00027 family)